MRIVYFMVIAALLFACGESNDTNKETPSDDNKEQDTAIVETVDSTNLENISEEEEEEDVSVTKFEVLEDYAKLSTRDAVIGTFPETYKNDTTWVAEGTKMMLTTHITNPENGHKITFFFDPETDPDFVSSLQSRYTRYDSETYEEVGNNELKSETGIYLGMPLKELHELNGAPITFAGFGWDFGGNARAHKGKLKDSDVNFMLDTEDYSDNSMIGDIMFSTEDETVRNKPIFVESMSIYL